jgi:hypothetical protein
MLTSDPSGMTGVVDAIGHAFALLDHGALREWGDAIRVGELDKCMVREDDKSS